MFATCDAEDIRNVCLLEKHYRILRHNLADNSISCHYRQIAVVILEYLKKKNLSLRLFKAILPRNKYHIYIFSLDHFSLHCGK